MRRQIEIYSLEMTSPADLRPSRPRAEGFRVEQARDPDARSSTVSSTPPWGATGTGSTAWGGPRRQWLAWLDRPELETWVGYLEGTPAGFFELERQPGSTVELAIFGLLPGFLGRGLGGALLTAAVERAWAMGASRVWVHTCSLDGPAALANYQARGFRLYATETVEKELPARSSGAVAGELGERRLDRSQLEEALPRLRRPPAMAPLRWLGTACSPACLTAASLPAAAPRVSPARPIGRGDRSAAGESRRPSAPSWRPGQVWRIAVEQRGIDVELAATGPDGRRVAVDAPFDRQGTETLVVEPAAAGSWDVEVDRPRAGGAAGPLRDPPRRAAPRDRRRPPPRRGRERDVAGGRALPRGDAGAAAGPGRVPAGGGGVAGARRAAPRRRGRSTPRPSCRAWWTTRGRR